MFKISFKEDYKKVQTFNDRATLVTLIGEMKIPISVGQTFPKEVFDWMWNHPSVDIQWGKNPKQFVTFRVEVSGKSVCAEEDVFDTVTGQRIAESRAKLKLFMFMWKLLDKLICHYIGIVVGNFEEHTNLSPYSENSLWAARCKYRELAIKEAHHLGKLLTAEEFMTV